VALVPKRTIPTEQPPLVGEVNAYIYMYSLILMILNSFMSKKLNTADMSATYTSHNWLSFPKVKTFKLPTDFKIWGSHGGDDEKQYLLGYDALW
jgi:hypothetical protein